MMDTSPRSSHHHHTTLSFHRSEHGITASPWQNDYGRDKEDASWTGRKIDNRYQVLEEIGSGGMGVVYKVKHIRLGKIAAMKVLHGSLATEPVVVDRFRQEAAAVSKLAHPHTVQVFDFGTAHGCLYLMMEFIRGISLGAIIDNDGAIEFSEVAPLIGQVCSALIEAHSLGIVHRDLKPDNVLVTRSGGRDMAKVVDFGLAKLAEREPTRHSTQRGLIVGTPYFMSPEQIKGDTVDGRSDIYSVGCMLYNALTAGYPFIADSPVGVLTQHLSDTPRPPSYLCPAVPPIVDDLVLRALEKRPQDRFPSAQAMLEAIENAQSRLSLSVNDKMTDTTHHPFLDHLPTGFEEHTELTLQRSDFATYERKLRNRRTRNRFLLPLILVLVVSAILYGTRRNKVRTMETESNNEAKKATRIGLQVEGHLGRRIDKTTPDRDFYLWKNKLPQLVNVIVTGLPNMDTFFTVFDASGNVLVKMDGTGVGRDETAHNIYVQGNTYVMVSQNTLQIGGAPLENISDTYTLLIQPHSMSEVNKDRQTEKEPNGDDSQATILPANTRMAGHLDQATDIDVYQYDGSTGSKTITITSKATIEWQWHSQPFTRKRKKQITVRPGQYLRIRSPIRRPQKSLQKDNGKYTVYIQ